MPKEQIIGDCLIQGGSIISGTGAKSYLGDLVTKNDKIIWMGNASKYNVVVDTIISAIGKIVTPGFIDLHAHGDPLKTPKFENFIAMGVTSIALGMDGSSQKSAEMELWMNAISEKPLGVNVLPFIGHGTVRTESRIGMSDDPNVASVKRMVDLVDHALDLGCWGLSMGLEYMPGSFAGKAELEMLAMVVGKHDALITSHIRNEDDDQIDKSLDEMIALSNYCNINISHLKVVYGSGTSRALEIINKIEKERDHKNQVTADLYPYNASYTGIGIVFPQWAKNPKRYKEIKEDRGDELLKFLRDKITKRNGPEATLFGTGPYAGKTLQDLVIEYNRPFEIILRDIIGPYGASAAYFVMNDELQAELIKSLNVMVGSDGSPTMRHPRGYGTFSKVIEEYVLRDSILTLEEAIYKMTNLPASTVGLMDRGKLEVGAKADILIFDPHAVKANATFEDPHKLASGMDFVMINGKISWSNEKLFDQSGRMLKKETSQP